MTIVNRRACVITSSTILVLLFVYDLHSDLDFSRSFAAQALLDPVPLPQALTSLLREKGWSLVAILLLFWGAIAELRVKRTAVPVNVLAYTMLLAIFVWDCVSLATGPREHLYPYMLAAGIPSGLIPVVILTLYRKDIVTLSKSKF